MLWPQMYCKLLKRFPSFLTIKKRSPNIGKAYNRKLMTVVQLQ